jgi:hypothetical protein
MSQRSQDAEDWTLRLPSGAHRDRVRSVLLRGRTYSSQSRETYSNHSTEELIGRISDPGLRREAEGWLPAIEARGR